MTPLYSCTHISSPGPDTFVTPDEPGDVRVPDHLRVHGALHLRGLPPALHQVSDRTIVNHVVNRNTLELVNSENI